MVLCRTVFRAVFMPGTTLRADVASNWERLNTLLTTRRPSSQELVNAWTQLRTLQTPNERTPETMEIWRAFADCSAISKIFEVYEKTIDEDEVVSVGVSRLKMIVINTLAFARAWPPSQPLV